MYELISMHLSWHRSVLVLLFAAALVSGCAASKDHQPLAPPVHMTDSEFADGIVNPIFNLLAALSAYYIEEGKAPENQQALALFTTKNGMPIDWHRFSRLELADDPEELVLRVLLISPSSLSDAGKIATSWRFSLSKARSRPDSPHFSVAPESRLCVLVRSRPDSMMELFLEAAIYLSRSAMSQETTFCFHPAKFT